MTDDPELLALRLVIGWCIRWHRKKANLSLAELSGKSRVSLGFLSQIELGKHWASVPILWRICRALEIPLSVLFAKGTQEAYEQAMKLVVYTEDEPQEAIAAVG